MGRSSTVVLVLVVLLFVEGLQLCFCKNSSFGCIESEREALLRLKHSFNDPSNRLVSWTGNDCCQWNGVSCNHNTGHVVKLDLRAPSPSHSFMYYYWYYYTLEQLSATEVNSCLVELKHLEYLDLSRNYFSYSPIPGFFGSLKHLRYLNLSEARFGGRIPAQLGNLSSLQILDLGGHSSELFADNFQWVSGLLFLSHLEMSYVDLSKALDLTHVLATLPSLMYLRLNGCGLQNNLFSRGSLNSSFLASVQFLSLKGNRLAGPIPRALQNMTALRELDLSLQESYSSGGGFFVDNLQWFSRLSSLQHLDMSGVNLSKAFDVMLVLNMLPSLVGLRLNDCGIKNIHFPRGSLNSTFLTSVQFLGLSGNGLTGSIPNALQNMTALRELDLSYQESYYSGGGLYVDNLQWVSRLSSLQHLDMSGVNLSKALDVMLELNTLPSLVSLRLSDCGIKNIHFPRGSLNSTFLTSVQFLDLSGNGLTGSIPNALQNMTSLRELDLSYQGIYYSNDGLYVDDLQGISRLSSLQHLDMSGVNLSKALDLMLVLNTLPSLVGLRLQDCGIKNIHFPRGSLNSTFLTSVQFLVLSDNGLTGSIPNALQNMTLLRELDLNHQWFTPYFGTYAAIDNLQGISRLSSLQYLDMSGVNLSKALDLMQVLNTLPSLRELHLDGCGIQNIHFTYGSLNSTFLESVQFLGLGNNGLKGTIPDALQNMTAVSSLDLSSNYFNSTIPLWIVNSKSLVDLNLRFNDFKNIEGGMLSMLNKACSLRSLDLSGNSFVSEILRSNKNSSTCLTYNLEFLSLIYNGISGNLPDYLGYFKGLKDLGLYGNSFHGPIPSSFGELSMLRSLYLPRNQLNGTIPQSFGRLSALRELDLSNNQLNGVIPQSLGRLSMLENLDLSNNKLIGYVPESLGQLVNLQTLDISSNCLQGVVSELNFANLSNLLTLDIGSNHLSCKFKNDWVPPFTHLNYINMSSCEFGSQFPLWIQTQKDVSVLDLSNATISGGFPIWLHRMSLSHLDLSSNKISGNLPTNVAEKMPRLTTLLLGDNLLNGQLPNSLCKLEALEVMDLSRNKLYGEIPRCWRDTQWFVVINLSDNKLSGTIPHSVGHLSYLKRLHLDKNNLTGELPVALRYCKELELLDLGENNFAGSIPTWIGENLSSLRILNLQKNMLNGSIPPQLCQLRKLQNLNLANNNLREGIPRCFRKLIGMVMEKVPGPISEQAVAPSASEPAVTPSTSEPTATPSASEPVVTPSISSPPADAPKPEDDDTNWNREKVRQVTKGVDLEYTKMQLKLLDILDLSSNKLVGIIPEELCLLSGLRGLNLSHNHLSGNIPSKIGELKLLESLDLSDNNLNGTIPQSMSALPSISHLNLSHNNLSGKIPTSNQLQTLTDPSIYDGNLDLCGNPLPKKCPGDDDSAQPPTSTSHGEKDHEDDKKEKILFYFVVLAGYATGLWGVIGTLVFKRSWRVAYFRFVDNTKEWMLAMVAVKVARLKRMMERTNSEE